MARGRIAARIGGRIDAATPSSDKPFRREVVAHESPERRDKGEECFLKTLVRGEKPLEGAKNAKPRTVNLDRQADKPGHDVKEATS